MKGGGLLNSFINNLPFELHLPGYNYCGPGTNLEKRLARGDRGINQLDDACMQHDIAYAKYNDLDNRHKADLQLLDMAKKRLKSKDARRGEKIASWLVNKVMKTKVKSGAGLKHFKSLVSNINGQLKKKKLKNKKSVIQAAYSAAKILTANKKPVPIPRIIPIPKRGGILPLIPIFAGLSALGSLAGGVAGIAKTINEYKTARQNSNKESIALGRGLYIKPYKSGNGLFVSQSKNY